MAKVKKTHDLKERIELVGAGRKSAEVKVLNLDSCKAENLAAVKEIIEAHTGLQELSLINIGLNSLAPCPTLPTLRKLWLCDNKLSGGLDHLVAACRNLEVLYLGGNTRIATVEILEPLKSLVSLRSLDLFGCNIMKVDEFHTKIWAMLPQLNNLDSFDRNGKEIPDSDEEDDVDAGDDQDDEYGDTSEDDINDENENAENGMEVQEIGSDSNADSEDDDDEDSDQGDESDEAGENAGPAEASSATSKGLKRKVDE